MFKPHAEEIVQKKREEQRKKRLAVISTMDEFTKAYIEALIFTSVDDDGEHLDDNIEASDIEVDSLRHIKEDCEKFQERASRYLDYMYRQGFSEKEAGHCFLYDRNGHGTGFWDKDYPKEMTKHLTDIAKCFGMAYLFGNDDVAGDISYAVSVF
jgi:hypothetical protein